MNLNKLILTIYLIFANLFDVVTTYITLKAGGIEINPMFSYINSGQMGHYLIALGIKILITVILLIIFYKVEKKRPVFATGLFYSITTMTFCVGLHNLLIYRHLI